MQVFGKELETKLNDVFDQDRVKFVHDTAGKYMEWNHSNSGPAFFENVILASYKDYPTDDMRFYQTLTELKSRIGRLFDDTIAFEKLKLEKEEIELDIEDALHELEGKQDKRRSEIKIKKLELDLNTKRVRLEVSRIALDTLYKEIEGFRSICDKYESRGVKPFELARLEEMDKKIKARYVNHLLTGIPLSPSEMAFYYQENGVMLPPPGTIEELQRLGREDLVIQEETKLLAAKRADQLRL